MTIKGPWYPNTGPWSQSIHGTSQSLVPSLTVQSQSPRTQAYLALLLRERPKEEEGGPHFSVSTRAAQKPPHVLSSHTAHRDEWNIQGSVTHVTPTPTSPRDRTSADFAINLTCLAMLISPFTEMHWEKKQKTKK